ncbi:MAG: hypothetical protein U9R20_02125, partial [Thermodesulfobacteriota bacterium]|nr:hypothetical protein [Thermodesulfobacteriota bacterium]
GSLHILREAFTDEKEFNPFKQHQKETNTRLSSPNGNAVGQTDTEQKKGKGEKKACRLTLY